MVGYKSFLFRIFKILVIVTIVILVLFLLLKPQGSWHDFLLNLISELIGILITIGFIELIIQNRDANKWKVVDKVVKKSIEDIFSLLSSGNNFFIQMLEVLMPINPNNLSNNLPDESKNNLFYLNYYKFNYEPLIKPILEILKESRELLSGYILCFNQAKKKYENGEKLCFELLDLHSDRLSPEIIATICEIRNNIKDIVFCLTRVSPIDSKTLVEKSQGRVGFLKDQDRIDSEGNKSLLFFKNDPEYLISIDNFYIYRLIEIHIDFISLFEKLKKNDKKE